MYTKLTAPLRTPAQPMLYLALLVLSLFLGVRPVQASPATDATSTPTNLTIASWGEYNATQQNLPTALYDVVAVAAGYEHSTVLKRDGTVVSWGKTPPAPAGLNNVVKIAAGRYGTLALKSDGTLVAWGSANFGQLDVPAGLTGVTAMAMGDLHSVAVKQDGTVVVWGRGLDPKLKAPAGLSDVVAVSASAEHNLALKRDGTVVAWGQSFSLGLQVPTGLSGVVAIAAGSNLDVALKSDGTVVTWGSADNLMNPPANLTDVIAIDVDQYHAVALKRDGTLVKWGYTYLLNIPDYAKGVNAVALGYGHTLTLLTDTTTPETTMAIVPTKLALNPSALGFGGTDNLPVGVAAPGLAFECSLDGSDFAACTSPVTYQTLSPGMHTFAVRAKDSAGNVDASPATYTWEIANCADGYDVVDEASLKMGLACFKQRTTPGAYTIRLLSDLATTTTQIAENSQADVSLLLDGQNHAWNGQRQIIKGFDVKPGTTVTIQNLTIHSFGVTGQGGTAIYNQGMLRILNSTITNNQGYYGAGVHSQDGTVDVENTTFTGNSSYGSGSSIALEFTKATIRRSSFTNNHAMEWAGGIFVNYGTVLTLTDVTFSNNSAWHGNPDIYNYEGAGTIVITSPTMPTDGQVNTASVADGVQPQRIFLPLVSK